MSKTIEAEIRAFEEMPELKKIREMARERLTEYRYLHTVEVAKRGVMLAHLYGGNSCKAYRAGLLHDFCKDMPKNEMLALIRQYIPDFEKRQCKDSWGRKRNGFGFLHESNDFRCESKRIDQS